jgi:hypothetical protein
VDWGGGSEERRTRSHERAIQEVAAGDVSIHAEDFVEVRAESRHRFLIGY